MRAVTTIGAAARAAVVDLSRWVDATGDRDPLARTWDRACKAHEEAGEASLAFLGWTQVGATHTRSDVVEELLDVALAALGAVEHLAGNAAPVSVDLLAGRGWPDPTHHVDPARDLLRVTGHGGRVVEAMVGWTGSNPRKGVTHTADDVSAALLDMAAAAMSAAQGLAGRPAPELLEDKILRVAARAGLTA